MSSAWNEYSDNSDSEQERFEPIVSEAVKLLFLRKYASTCIPEEELIKIFQDCNYEDNAIQKSINERLKCNKVPYVIIEKPFNKSKNNDFEETVSHDKSRRNYRKAYNKKNNKHYQSSWEDYSSSNSNYYKSSFPYKKNKKHYGTSKINKRSTNYYGNEDSNQNYYQVEKEIALEDNCTENMENEVDEGDMIVSKTFSKVSTVSGLSLNNDSKEKDSNPFVLANSPTCIEKTTSEVISELRPKDNINLLSSYSNYFFDNGSNYVKKEPQLYESKLFPGVYFTKPIENKQQKEQSWKNVFDYYSPVKHPENIKNI